MFKNKLLLCGLVFLTGMLLVSCSDNRKDILFGHLKARLNLSDDQAAKVRPIFEKQMQKVMEIIKEAKSMGGANTFGTKEASSLVSGEASTNPYIIELQDLAKQTATELTPILSAQQLEEYNKMVNEQIERLKSSQNGSHSGRRRGGSHRGGGYGQMGMPGTGF